MIFQVKNGKKVKKFLSDAKFFTECRFIHKTDNAFDFRAVFKQEYRRNGIDPE